MSELQIFCSLYRDVDFFFIDCLFSLIILGKWTNGWRQETRLRTWPKEYYFYISTHDAVYRRDRTSSRMQTRVRFRSSELTFFPLSKRELVQFLNRNFFRYHEKSVSWRFWKIRFLFDFFSNSFSFFFHFPFFVIFLKFFSWFFSIFHDFSLFSIIFLWHSHVNEISLSGLLALWTVSSLITSKRCSWGNIMWWLQQRLIQRRKVQRPGER